MSELESLIVNYPGGREALARWLLANPTFAAFNMLWKGPHHILALVRHFRLTTLAEAADFAARLTDGTAWVTRRDELAAWLTPRPGFFLSDVPDSIAFDELQRFMASGVIPTHPQYDVRVNDHTFYLPTYDQALALSRACPARRFERVGEAQDCDDYAIQMQAWLRDSGLGTLAAGFGGYVAYDGANNILGGHAVLLVVTNTRTVFMGDPETGQLVTPGYLWLGGFLTAARIAFTQAIF